MKRIAFFVEGLTEQLFLIKFIEEAYGKTRIAITSTKGMGGNKHSISFTTIQATSITSKTEYYILINDCGGDGNLKSYIIDQRNNLLNKHYSKIIGIRDVYPSFSRADINKLKYGLYYGLPQTDIRTDFILSVMEIEAWFLSEHTHFNRIDGSLNAERINSALSFHPENEDMEQRENPARDLHNSYQIVGKAYGKERIRVERTINSLDFSHLYFNPKPSSLQILKKELDLFFD